MAKKILLLSSIAMITLFALLMPFAQAQAAVPTVGSIDGPSNVKANLGFYIKYDSATDGGLYIIVPSVTTMGFANYTFTASGTTGVVGPFIFTSTGSITLTLYGASATNTASGSALATYQINVNKIGSGVVNTALFSDLISFLLPIMIIVMIVLAFKFRDRLPGMHRSKD